MLKPKAILTVPETPDTYGLTVRLYPDGFAVLSQSGDTIVLSPDKLSALRAFLFNPAAADTETPASPIPGSEWS